MKKMKMMMMCLLTVAPVLAFAHGSKVDLTQDVIQSALQKFTTEEAAQVASFVGVKGWIDQANVMVKVYLTNNNAITYSCSVMEMGGGQPDMITCAKQ